MTTTRRTTKKKGTEILRPGRKDLVRGTVVQVDDPESTTERWGRRAVLWLAVEGTPQVICVRCWGPMVDVHAELKKDDRLELRNVWVMKADPHDWRLSVSVSHPWQVAVLRPPAAPDLLASCRELADYAENCLRMGGDDGEGPMVERARAAIARAEGRG